MMMYCIRWCKSQEDHSSGGWTSDVGGASGGGSSCASQQVGGGDEDRTKRCEQRGVDGGGECGVLEVAVIVMCAV